jgi:hypothetical protein
MIIEHMDSFGINFYKILWNKYFSIKTILNKKLWTTKLHNLSISITFILVVSPSEILFNHYSLVTLEQMDSFGINSIKYYDTYLDIQMISNQKSWNNKVVYLRKYYNFGIKFVIFIKHYWESYEVFHASYHYRFKTRISNNNPISLPVGRITISFSQKLAVMGR